MIRHILAGIVVVIGLAGMGAAIIIGLIERRPRSPYHCDREQEW